jgi:hypothetical protein
VRDFFLSQPPPEVAGLLLGVCVIALYVLINARLGVVGGFSDIVERLSARSVRLSRKGWFVLGIAGGGTLFALATGGGRVRGGYGWLTRDFSDVTAIVLLVVAGVLIGYGAKTASGCTSGNGLTGNATGSRASHVATVTFFATAVVASLATKWLFGAGL